MAKARARQLPLTKAVDTHARTQNKLVGNQTDRGKTELSSSASRSKPRLAASAARRPRQS